jgi:hypothetical protein
LGDLTWLIMKHCYAGSQNAMQVEGRHICTISSKGCGGFASSWGLQYNCNNTKVGVFLDSMGDHSERSPHLGQGKGLDRQLCKFLGRAHVTLATQVNRGCDFTFYK